MHSEKFTAVAILLLVSAFAPSMASAAPRLILSTVAVGPVYVGAGTNGAAQTVEAFNAGDGSLNLSPSASAAWLSATVGGLRACTTRTGNCLPVSISLNTSALAIGAYTESITLNDPNAVDTPQQIFVTVSIVGVPSSLSFYVTPAAANPIVTSGSEAATPIFTQSKVATTVTTQSGGKWLTVTTGASGSVPFGVSYYVQAAAQVGQLAGLYNGSVAIVGSANPNDNKTVAVAMNITTAPIVQLGFPALRLTGYTGGAKGATTMQFTNSGLGSLAITAAAATSSTGGFLSASVVAPDTIQVTADPAGLAAGIYTGAVTVTSNAANNSQVSVPVTFQVSAAGTPQISSGGIVNATSYVSESFAPGEILAVFGDQLAVPGTAAVNTGAPPLATTLGGVQVLVNGVPAPLFFASPGQVNVQLPYELPPGSLATVQVVSNGKAGNLRSVNIVPNSARMMVWGANVISGGYGIIVNQDYSLTLPSTTSVPGFATHPAHIGDTVTIYGIGFGQTTPAAVTGAAASGTTLQSVNSATVAFGGAFYGNATFVPASYAGLTPSAVGLYQVNAQIPPTTPIGPSVPITLTINGVIGNYVFLAISN